MLSVPMKRGMSTSSKPFISCPQKVVPQAALSASMVPYLCSHHLRKAARALSE